MTWIRKNEPGADSLGHVWPEAGSVVEMPAEQAADLLSIQGAGFTEAEAPAKPAKRSKATTPAPDDGKAGDDETGAQSSADGSDDDQDGETDDDENDDDS